MNKALTQFDQSIVQRLAPMMRLSDVGFRHIEGKVIGEILSESFSFATMPIPAEWMQLNGAYCAVFPFGFDLRSSPKDGGEPVNFAEIRIVMRIEYKLADVDPPPTIEDLSHFVGMSGFMHCWPYIRAEVQALTLKLGLPPLVLPLMFSGHAQQFVRLSYVTLPSDPPPLAA